MTKRKKHSKEEIAAKLAQATEMANHGKLQGEIANTLGVSVMTLHRWRKPLAKSNAPSLAPDETTSFEHEFGQGHFEGNGQRMSDLQLENSRLRRLVTDLLLEKMKLIEEMQAHSSNRSGMKLAR